jgi:hypothetical protein
VASSSEVAAFCNDLNVPSLQVLTNGSAVKFFAGTFGIVETGYLDVHFVKRGKEELDAKNMPA